jgi:two-component system, sensor histidine kinase PdtaS
MAKGQKRSNREAKKPKMKKAPATVPDNGRGIVDPRPGGSGQKLIQALARQIGGEIELAGSNRGTSVSVTFPVVA